MNKLLDTTLKAFIAVCVTLTTVVWSVFFLSLAIGVPVFVIMFTLQVTHWGALFLPTFLTGSFIAVCLVCLLTVFPARAWHDWHNAHAGLVNPFRPPAPHRWVQRLMDRFGIRSGIIITAVNLAFFIAVVVFSVNTVS